MSKKLYKVIVEYEFPFLIESSEVDEIDELIEGNLRDITMWETPSVASAIEIKKIADLPKDYMNAIPWTDKYDGIRDMTCEQLFNENILKEE